MLMMLGSFQDFGNECVGINETLVFVDECDLIDGASRVECARCGDKHGDERIRSRIQRQRQLHRIRVRDTATPHHHLLRRKIVKRLGGECAFTEAIAIFVSG